MTFDLMDGLRALGHDAGVREASLDVSAMLARVHRGRVVRTTALGVAGAGVTAAVAVGVLVPTGGTTPLVPGAAPGECGSALRSVTSTGDGPAIAVRSAPLDALEPREHHLGPLAGRTLAVEVAPSVPTDDADLRATVMQAPLLVARDGVVVAVATPNDAGASFRDVVTVRDLLTCATPDDPGGDALPAGTYEVAAVADGGAWRSVSTPVDLTLLEERPPLTGLPDDLPWTFPVVGERVVEAVELDQTGGSGWLVTVVVDGTDGLVRAVRELERAGGVNPGSDVVDPWLDRVGMVTWDGSTVVDVREGRTRDGRTTVVYRTIP